MVSSLQHHYARLSFVPQDKKAAATKANDKARCRAEDRGATLKPKAEPISIAWKSRFERWQILKARTE